MNHPTKKTCPLGRFAVLLMVLTLIAGLLPSAAMATEGDVALTGSIVADCLKGDTITVSFTIPEEVYVCDFTALISYDTKVLEPVKTENANGEMVWADTEVFAAGVVSNLVEGEGIRVAGATAQAGYKKGGKLLILSFRVMEDIPANGTEVTVGFSVFHVAKTADATQEMTVAVTPAKLLPGEKQATQPSETPSTTPTESSTTPTVPVETTKPVESTAPQETTTKPTEGTTTTTQPNETSPTTVPGTTAPQATEPSGGEAPDESPVGLILGVCGGVAVVAGILLFVLLKKRKQRDA